MTVASQNTPELRLGTRRSPLAMAQAEETRDRLCAAHGWPQSAVELVPVVASGDRIQDRPLAEIGGKALWTRELDAWLAEGRIDVAVHSMKDVETLRPDSLTIAAILPRADKRDVLVGAASLADLAPGAKVGTSAPRRAAQALHARPDIEVVMFRGNVATRLGKLEAGEADATFLAKAGLDRLGEDAGITLAVDAWLPAPAQGAIGLECRTDDSRTRQVLAAIDDKPSHAEVLAERAVLEGLGGTCQSPIAMLSTCRGTMIDLRCALYSPDGRDRVEGEATMSVGDLTGAKALAADLLSRAPASIRSVFEAAR
ncbi:hydroxymethylbilane synthase [Erythrobacteraceae bacterium WH01K]|nr:hydroxymethylbilane synthase [Erythrobacteraceae bacterium WH01K]